MSKREPLMDEALFQNGLRYIDSIIESRLTKLREQAEAHTRPRIILWSSAT